jgi:hypothetical protein
MNVPAYESSSHEAQHSLVVAIEACQPIVSELELRAVQKGLIHDFLAWC